MIKVRCSMVGLTGRGSYMTTCRFHLISYRRHCIKCMLLYKLEFSLQWDLSRDYGERLVKGGVGNTQFLVTLKKRRY